MKGIRLIHRHVSRWAVTIPFGNGMEPDPCALCSEAKALWMLTIRITGRELAKELEPVKRIPLCDGCVVSIDDRGW